MIKNILAVSLVGSLALTGIAAYFTDSQKSTQIKFISDPAVQLLESEVKPSQISQRVGRSAYIDPKTGELVSEPAQSTPAIQAGSSSAGVNNLPPVKITTHANGMVQADLNGRFKIPLQATVGCDGKVTKQHTNRGLSTATNCDAEK